MEYVNLEPKRPENIALSFSGGGFRAASFTLGCLSYMEMVQLGDQKLTSLIHFISSASGGTITNLAYTAGQRNGQPFDDFYQQLNQQLLQGSILVDRVFEIMVDKKLWKERPLKSRNLINAFSIAYDELLFKKETFGVYWKQTPNAVAEVCANTTEFDNAMLFRFQNAGDVGNKFLNFKQDATSLETLGKIKLADILACSSCFPVGFEPFMFPADFTSATISKQELEKAIQQDSKFSAAKSAEDDEQPPHFGLMDGGIDDNQGIDSFIRAEERMQNKNKFGYDLYICCDVSSNYTKRYDFPKENKRNFLQKPSLLTYIIALLLLFAMSIVGIKSTFFTNLSYALLGLSSFLVVLVLLFSITGFMAYRKSIHQKNTYGLLIFKHIFFFLKLRLSKILQIIDSRATSAADLAAVVFLKKIRRISYDRLFEKITELKFKANGELFKPKDDASKLAKVGLKHWRQFSLQNAIYLLSNKNNPQRLMDLKNEPWYKTKPFVTVNNKRVLLEDAMQPSFWLQSVADLATEMDTTLWFDQNHINDNRPVALIATGQFTTCYNLLRYAFRFDSNDAYWATIQNNLLTDWNAFQANPYYLHEKYSSKQ